MIDIHTHILPAVDDGARTFAESLTMLAMAAADGTTDVILTPHADLRYVYDSGRAAADLQLLQAAAPQPRLHAGCELLITPENLERAIEAPTVFTLAGSSYLLVELPGCVGPRIVLDALARLQQRGLRPIIAHPERSLHLRDIVRIATELVRQGCYLQLTARSILGGFGPETARAGERLLENGLAHFVASDAHGNEHRRPLLRTARDRIAHWIGAENADLLFVENGRSVLADRPVRSLSIRRAARVRLLVLSLARQRAFHAG